MSTRPAPEAPLPGLDLLRAIAVVWVMLFHSFIVGGLGPDWAWLSRYGWMGVDLFFVLSGFLIGRQVLAPLAAGEAFSLGAFYWRRAWRILPAYWVVLVLYLTWPALREAAGMEPAWKFLLFVLNLDIDYAHRAAFSHAWSLCVEEHFYALFPLLALGLMRIRSAWRTGLLALLSLGLLLGGMGLRAAAWLQHTAADPQMLHPWFVEAIYYPTWNRLDGLWCGVLLASVQVFRPAMWSRARRQVDAIGLLGLGLMGLSFGLFADRVGLLANTLGWPVLSLALACLVFAGAGRDSWLGRWRLPLAGPLAAMSYSLYLVHKAVFHLVQSLWGKPLAGTGPLAFLAYGGAAVLAGAALYLLVERPALRWR